MSWLRPGAALAGPVLDVAAPLTQFAKAKATNSPSARSGHVAVLDDEDNMYVYGGTLLCSPCSRVGPCEAWCNPFNADVFWLKGITTTGRSTFTMSYTATTCYPSRGIKFGAQAITRPPPARSLPFTLSKPSSPLAAQAVRGLDWVHNLCRPQQLNSSWGCCAVPFGENNSNELHLFDLKTSVWRLLTPATADCPTPRFGQVGQHFFMLALPLRLLAPLYLA